MEGWIEELLLTYICLFVVLDEFSELKVSCNNGDLEREEEEETELKGGKTNFLQEAVCKNKII